MTQPDADPWGFDEQPVDTWANVLAPQITDLVLLSLFIVFAMISFHRRSKPLNTSR